MTLQGFEVVAAKPKGERASQDEPVQQPIRPGEKSPADRRNLTNDERTVKRRRRRVHAAFSGPGYYLVDKDAAPQSGRYESMSEAEADLQPESGHLVQYLSQAPNSSHIAEPFPPNLNQVNGSLSMSARTDDEFAFEAMSEGDSEWDEPEEKEEKTAASDLTKRLDDAYYKGVHDEPTEAEREQMYEEGIAARNKEDKTAAVTHTEADLLAAMAKATGPEQRALMGELEGLRRQARRQAIADREIDLADAFIHATLTPVRVHEHHTAATDWIEDVAEPDLGAQAVHRAMVVEAQRWKARISEAVKEDREEYAEQARGVARLAASAMGEHRDLAFQTFMRTAMDGEQDQNAPASMIAPWGAPPMQLPPVGGGDAPFGVPTGGGPLNGVNFNPMATEVYPGSQVLPLDNGASAWPPAENLEGEAPLPPVAPDNYRSVASLTQQAAGRSEYSPRSGMGGRDQGPWRATHTYNPIGWDAFDSRPHPGSKPITPGVPVMNHGYMSPRGPGGMRLVHVSDEAGNHQTIDSRSLADLDDYTQDAPNPERSQFEGRRRTSSENFNGPKQTYAEYQARLSEGATPMDEEHWAGSMASVSPSASNSVIPVTGMLHWADGVSQQKRDRAEEGGHTLPGTDKFPIENKSDLEKAKHDIGRTNEPHDKVVNYINRRAEELGGEKVGEDKKTSMLRWGERNTTSDPSGAQLAGNPMAGYPAGGDWDKEQAHAQSGEAQSSLPLAPEGPEVAQHLDWITDFPDTGPAEVPSDRAFNISTNESQAGHGSGVSQQAARIPDAGGMTFNPDPGYADEYRLDDDLGTDQYMSEIPHDFEASGNSQYCRHCGESRRHPMHVYARRMAADQGTFKVDRSQYPMAPEGDAAATVEYEQAYSSDRPIDYSETGIGELGTVPVQGYGVNPSGEMFTWQIGPPGPRGANDVANVPTPGAGTMGAPQPSGLELPEGKEARLRALRSRVQRVLAGQYPDDYSVNQEGLRDALESPVPWHQDPRSQPWADALNRNADPYEARMAMTGDELQQHYEQTGGTTPWNARQARNPENQWSNPGYSLGDDDGSNSND